MKINVWDLFKYVFKWKWLVVFAAVVSVFAAKLYVDKNQHIQSKIVIQYKDECISTDGTTPKGDPFEPYEIVSPDVLTGAIKDLGLSGSVDSIRSRITITPIIPESEKDMQASKLKDGEEYSYHANTYTITYSGRVGESEAMARDILDAVIDNYLVFYTTNYVTQAAVDDVTFDEDIGGYDYVEAAEIMNSRVSKIIESLSSYYQQDVNFRAPTTGKTFKDINDEYTHLKEYEISQIFADIYKGQITKDKDLLIKKYSQRREDNMLQKQNFQEKADLTKDRMDTFAEANKEMPNSYNENTEDNNDGLEIIDGVYDYSTITNHETGEREPHSTTTTYDGLVMNYASNKMNANNCDINAAFCDEIVAKFTGTMTYTGDITVLTNSIEERLYSAKSKMMDMYKELSMTIDDYNSSNASKHIRLLTGVSYSSVLSLSLYVMIFGALAVMVSVLFAVSIELMKRYRETGKNKNAETVNAEKKRYKFRGDIENRYHYEKNYQRNI